jgi:tight adherence protein B
MMETLHWFFAAQALNPWFWWGGSGCLAVVLLGLFLRLWVWQNLLPVDLKATQPNRLGTYLPSTRRLGSKRQLESQLAPFLRALASTVRAGVSVPKALLMVSAEVKSPLKESLELGRQQLEWQQPLAAVMHSWRTGVSVREFVFFTRSVELHERNGGDLVAICLRVSDLIDERLKLEQDLRSFTAQGQLSGWLMIGLWPLSLGLFSVLAPQHMSVLWETTAGQSLLLISLGLQLIGACVILRLVRIDLGS